MYRIICKTFDPTYILPVAWSLFCKCPFPSDKVLSHLLGSLKPPFYYSTSSYKCWTDIKKRRNQSKMICAISITKMLYYMLKHNVLHLSVYSDNSEVLNKVWVFWEFETILGSWGKKFPKKGEMLLYFCSGSAQQYGVTISGDAIYLYQHFTSFTKTQVKSSWKLD